GSPAQPAPSDSTAASQGAPSDGTATASQGVWDRLAGCESGGDWSIDSTYDGGLQFDPDTWRAYGGARYAPQAHQATRSQQIAVAQRVRSAQGWSAWPACSRRLGLR
ncbi:MAG: transglycosylase family protein, partial [Actinomycetota bacterium]|nr:transglycosylase family protein [Actinomycetota bacterium]